MAEARTLYRKVWEAHKVLERADGEVLLYVDRHFVTEGSFHAFENLRREGRRVRRPNQTFGVADHYVPTRDRHLGPPDPEARATVDLFLENTSREGVATFGPLSPDQGIVHVVGPEQGLTQPGLVIVCGDSHTSTHGAFGALAFGIGASEGKHVLATQAIWQRPSRSFRVVLEGRLSRGVSAKDLILALIGKIGAGGATGHVLEYAGPAVTALSMEGRMTLCNMSIEAGARAGLIGPDETTYQYLAGRPYAPRGADWDRALQLWRSLPSDPDARFDREVSFDASSVAPMVTWGISPEQVLPVTGQVPDPAGESDPQRRAGLERALRYMGLTPGTPLEGLPIDRVFIGSCTNSRVEDLRLAAAMVRGRKARVPAMISPGSRLVKRQAEAEGLDQVFLEAGFEWRDSGCSMCVGMNGDLVAAGERCASTSNRNFEGRQGAGARTHLMSPAMAAAAAVTGAIVDLRPLIEAR